MKDDSTKKLDPRSLVIGMLLTMVIVAFMLLTTMGGSQGQAWEYKTMDGGSGLREPALNQLGDENWELVGFSKSRLPNNLTSSDYIFKRRKKDSSRWKFWK